MFIFVIVEFGPSLLSATTRYVLKAIGGHNAHRLRTFWARSKRKYTLIVEKQKILINWRKGYEIDS